MPSSCRCDIGRWRLERHDGNRCPVCGNLGHDVPDLITVKAHGDDGIGSACARFTPHSFTGLVAAVSKQLGIPGGLPAGYSPQLRAYVAEIIACPDYQPEDITVDSRDPVAGHLIGGDDQDGLGIADRFRRRLRADQVQAVAGHVGGQLTQGGGGGVVTAGVAAVGCLAPDAVPGFVALLQCGDVADNSAC